MLINVQITMEELQIVEHIVRVDPKVIEQCGIVGIPKEEMHKVYCDRMWKVFQHRTLILTGGSLDYWV